MTKIFISYRRDDSAGYAGRIHDRLDREFGRELLSMDVDSVPLGENFAEVLRVEVASCDVLLILIGPNWLESRDKEGRKRLDEPADLVRMEVATALKRNIPIIPILLEGAAMPKSDELPIDIREISLRNGLNVRHTSFHADMDTLIQNLKRTKGKPSQPPKDSSTNDKLAIPVVRHAQLGSVIGDGFEPDRPSVAVLPFVNMSGVQDQDYFADGITEDIITEVSRFSDLFVIARNSSFQYKGRAVDIRQVRRELGVRYVLEGSVQKSANRVRITAQLIDATTGHHRWAERYDRLLEDIFSIQDEVARVVATLLVAHVNRAELERSMLKSPSKWEAHDYFLRGNEVHNAILSRWSTQLLQEARQYLQRSIRLDPKYARAYAVLGETYVMAWLMPLNDEHQTAASLDRAFELISKAVEYDPALPLGHAFLGNVLLFRREFDACLIEWETTFKLNPNFTDWRYAQALMFAGYPDECVSAAKRHMRLDPHFVPMAACVLGIGYLLQRKFAEAVPPLLDCVTRAPSYLPGRYSLITAYALEERMEEAKAQARGLLQMVPNFTINKFVPLSNFRRQADIELCVSGLRRAGLT